MFLNFRITRKSISLSYRPLMQMAVKDRGERGRLKFRRGAEDYVFEGKEGSRRICEKLGYCSDNKKSWCFCFWIWYSSMGIFSFTY